MSTYHSVLTLVSSDASGHYITATNRPALSKPPFAYVLIMTRRVSEPRMQDRCSTWRVSGPAHHIGYFGLSLMCRSTRT